VVSVVGTDLATASRARLARLDALRDAPAEPGATPTRTALSRVRCRHERAALTGRDDDLAAAQDAAEAAVGAGHVCDDLLVSLARIHLESHDLAGATAALDRCRFRATSTAGRGLRAAVALQAGDPVAAAGILRSLCAEDPSWSHVAGLAGVYEELGDTAGADELYRLAELDLDATQMTSFAWVALRRAALAGVDGDPDRAGRHLDRAAAAAFGWRVATARARWHLAQGELAEAAALAGAVLARTGRPDAEHLCHDVCRAAGEAERAAGHRARALAGYRAASARWPWRYLHHEVELHLGTDPPDVARALELAERDHRARPGAATGRALVAALRQAGSTTRADELASGLAASRSRARARIGDPFPLPTASAA
jgi:tetratricopeptide (TPR) repeat protein